MKISLWASAAVTSLCIGLLVTTLSNAQSGDMRSAVEALAGTLSVVATPMISSGKLTGCTVVFEHLQRDDLYLGGNFIKVSGSLGIMGVGDQVGFVMKALANEFDPDTMVFESVNLARIYLVTPEFRTNFESLVDSYPSDVPGGIFAVFQFDPSITMLLEAFAAGTVNIAIGPEIGSSDIQIVLDLSVEETDDSGLRNRSNKSMSDFLECSKGLVGDKVTD